MDLQGRIYSELIFGELYFDVGEFGTEFLEFKCNLEIKFLDYRTDFNLNKKVMKKSWKK